MITYYEQASERANKQAKHTYSAIYAQDHIVYHGDEWKSKSRTHMIHAEMRAGLFACESYVIVMLLLLLLLLFAYTRP